jgi:hypothetical protein
MTKFCTDKPVAQGDILIVPIAEIPASAKAAQAEKGVFIITHSETGHNHVIEKARAEVFESADDSFIAYIHALGDGAEIKHLRDFDTHETIALSPGGNYEVRRQREYIPEGFRRAQD